MYGSVGRRCQITVHPVGGFHDCYSQAGSGGFVIPVIGLLVYVRADYYIIAAIAIGVGQCCLQWFSMY